MGDVQLERGSSCEAPGRRSRVADGVSCAHARIVSAQMLRLSLCLTSGDPLLLELAALAESPSGDNLGLIGLVLCRLTSCAVSFHGKHRTGIQTSYLPSLPWRPARRGACGSRPRVAGRGREAGGRRLSAATVKKQGRRIQSGVRNSPASPFPARQWTRSAQPCGHGEVDRVSIHLRPPLRAARGGAEFADQRRALSCRHRARGESGLPCFGACAELEERMLVLAGSLGHRWKVSETGRWTEAEVDRASLAGRGG